MCRGVLFCVQQIEEQFQSGDEDDFDETDDETPKENGTEPVLNNEEEILDEVDEGISILFNYHRFFI